MTRWTVRTGDILDCAADLLIMSANPYLTFSGGVGGAFLQRYGPEMQEALQAYLRERGLRHVPRGSIIRMPSCGSPFKCVLHAVAVDATYASSSAVIKQIVTRTIQLSAQEGARTVAMPALATGYGQLSMAEFVHGVRPLMSRDFEIDEVVICLRSARRAAEFRNVPGGAPD